MDWSTSNTGEPHDPIDFWHTARGRSEHLVILKIAIIAFLNARIVDPDCTYQNGYYNPGFGGVCVAEALTGWASGETLV